MSNPDGEQPRHVKGGVVALGIVLGVAVTFVWMFLVFILALGTENGSSNNRGWLADWMIAALFALPLPASILLLCFRRTRQAGAGFVMGMAIGTLVLAGFCTSLLVPGLTA